MFSIPTLVGIISACSLWPSAQSLVSKPSPSVKSGGKKTVASNEGIKGNKVKKQAEKNLAKKTDSKEKESAGTATEDTSSKPATAQKAKESKQK